LIPVSRLVKYLHATRGFGPRDGESLIEAVADQICISKGEQPPEHKTRKFVERNRDVVNLALAGQKRALAKPAPARKPKPMEPSFVMTDEFLWSYEWRRVRMVALKKYGPRCMCCGATPSGGATMNVDHIKPRRIFPELALDVDNLQVLCADCNHGKGNWDMTDWRRSEEASVP
jgi:5-methylcytosine-specific restriction endonuclease McrA